GTCSPSAAWATSSSRDPRSVVRLPAMTEAMPPDPMSEESDVGWGDDQAEPDWGDDADREVDVDGQDSDLGWGSDELRPPYDTPGRGLRRCGGCRDVARAERADRRRLRNR